MGNLVSNPRFKLSLRSSCCTAIISSDDDDDAEGEIGIRLSIENGSIDADQRTLEQRQDSVSDPPTYEEKGIL